MTQISRLKDAEISNGNLINADDLDDELDQLVTESNDQDTRLTDIEDNDMSIHGIKTFSSIPLLPASDPTTANQAARKAYVDANTGGSYRPGFVTGRYYPPEHANGVTSGSAGQGIGSGTNTVVVPFFVGATTTFDRISINVSANVGASTVQLGIYNSGTNGKPSTRVVDAGTVSAATTGVKEATINQSLTAGWYWLAARASSSSIGLFIYNLRDGDLAKLTGLSAVPTVSLTGSVSGVSYEDAAAIPATFTASPTLLTNSGTNQPAIYLRVA